MQLVFRSQITTSIFYHLCLDLFLTLFPTMDAVLAGDDFWFIPG